MQRKGPTGGCKKVRTGICLLGRVVVWSRLRFVTVAGEWQPFHYLATPTWPSLSDGAAHSFLSCCIIQLIPSIGINYKHERSIKFIFSASGFLSSLFMLVGTIIYDSTWW